jgi:predicted DsbA family dithiol-disulfide isomerase
MPISVKVFSDYICPFCYLGKAILNKLKSRYYIEIEHIGFEIHPETNAEGIDLRGRIAGIDELYENIRSRGKEYGINFCDLGILANSRKALLVGEYARELGKNDEFTDKIFRSYFEDCQNISLEKVIVNVAKNVGLPESGVMEALSNPKYGQILSKNILEGKKHNVCGVPTFIVNEKYEIVGAQPEQVFVELFERIKKESGE